MIKLYLTKSEYNYVNKLIRNQIEQLKNMSPNERINWYNSSLFNNPINFTKEIDNTIYTVNTHFNDKSTESIEEKTVRILEQQKSNIKIAL